LIDIVCFGVGNFFSCPKAQSQMALIALLKEQLHMKGELFLYDPILNEMSISFAEKMGWTVLSINEEGKHKIFRTTIFFMPHCGRALYNNLLWANWEPSLLSDMAIIGNSFQRYANSLIEKSKRQEQAYIEKIIPFTMETELENDFSIYGAFNDTSFHQFLPTHLYLSNEEIWKEPEPPIYSSSNQEIILNDENRKQRSPPSIT